MKEVTRIHIAKVSYDIELEAKKAIEKYIKALEVYAGDKELLEDIEIRITELLAERNVKQNGVITSADVKAVREQLGEPEDFAGDGDMAIGSDGNVSSEPTRKLFRNTDNAVLGGVLSGIASYFNVSPLWTRLAFVILFFVTSGFVLVIYIFLWIFLPPARTAAEKLQMTGRPITLASIRGLGESEAAASTRYEQAKNIRKVLITLSGIMSLLLAIATLMLTIFGAVAALQIDRDRYLLPSNEWFYLSAYALMILSGLLLTTLFTLGAYALLKRSFTKKLLISSVIIVILGTITFGTAIGLAGLSVWRTSEEVRSQITERPISLPEGFDSIKNLNIDVSSDISVQYIVSSETKAVFESLPKMNTPVISLSGQDAKLTIDLSKDKSYYYGYYSQPRLKIYGPALNNLSMLNGGVSYIANQQELSVDIKGSSTVRLEGNYEAISAKLDQGSLDGESASIKKVVVDMKNSSSLSLGTVDNLMITSASVCAVDNQVDVRLRGANGGVININGKDRAVESFSSECLKVSVGKSGVYYDNY